MKKTCLHLRTFLALLCAVLLLPALYNTAQAVIEGEIDGLQYRIEDGKATITKYTGSATEVHIPATVKDAPVTRIREYAFNGCMSFSSITIPDSVTSIGMRAFRYCRSLTSVVLPSNLEMIDVSVFDDCTSLAYVTIPKNVTSIYNWAFSGCTSLTSIAIPPTVTFMSEDVFLNTPVTIYGYLGSRAETYAQENGIPFVALGGITPDGLEYEVNGAEIIITGYNGAVAEIIIPDRIRDIAVTSIGKAAFVSCSSLTSVHISNGITSIGDSAFSGCNNLKTVTIPNSITRIGHNAFYECGSLETVNIPSGIDKIESGTFAYCRSLASITIPSNVKSIGATAFSACGLKTVHIENGLNTIGDNAFCWCSKLENIILPGSVSSIGNYAFYDCGNLRFITIPDSVTNIGKAVFEESYVDIICSMGSAAHTYAQTHGIPFTVEGQTLEGLHYRIQSVDGDVFATIVLYDGVGGRMTIPGEMEGVAITSIEDRAFANHITLRVVTIPDGVYNIREHAFSGCSNLQYVIIPKSVTSIEAGAFDLSPNVTIRGYPGSQAHAYAQAHGIPFVSESQKTPEGMFYAIEGEKATIIDYTGTAAAITIPDRLEGVAVTGIGKNAFRLSGITSAKLPGSITSIGAGAFSYSNLQSINIPGGVKSIPDDAFYGTELASVILPRHLTSIGKYAFGACDLTFIAIPPSVTSIGEEAFYHTELTIHCYRNSKAHTYAQANGIAFEVIGSQTPEGLYYRYEDETIIITGYTGTADRIEIPSTIEGLTVIGIDDAAFVGSSLASVTIPASVTTISEGAFHNTSAKIHGNTDSAAHTYAKARNIPFVALDATAALRGDANGDRNVDILDLVAIIDYIVSGTPCVSMENADANGDGDVDILDLVWIIDKIVGG